MECKIIVDYSPYKHETSIKEFLKTLNDPVQDIHSIKFHHTTNIDSSNQATDKYITQIFYLSNS